MIWANLLHFETFRVGGCATPRCRDPHGWRDTHRGLARRPRRTTYPDEVRTRPALVCAVFVALGSLVAGCTTTPTATTASSGSAPTPSANATTPSSPSATQAPTAEGSQSAPGTSPASSQPSAAPSSPGATSTDGASPSATPSASSSRPRPSASSSRPGPTPSYVVPSREAPTEVSPLDGLGTAIDRPVLIVKLDNTTYAQPHAGLNKADLVYIEEVEYGITRLAAVFSSHIPRRIGPVRSARITDIDLLAQYDRPAFGYSGAQRRLFPALHAAPFYDVSPYTGGSGYSRDNRRRAPYNLYFNGQTGLARAPKASLPHDVGFRFDPVVPAGGLVAKTADMSWSYAKAGFRYDPQSGLYDISLNGRRAQAEETSDGQRAATVVIQSVKQTPSKYFDKGGGNTPHAETIGSGTALVLRDGQVWKTRWSRPRAQDGTTFTLADSSVMPFKPGQLWIVLLDSKRKATVKPLTQPKPVVVRPSASATVGAAATPAGAVPSPASSASPAAQ